MESVRRAWRWGFGVVVAAVIGGCAGDPPPPAEQPKVDDSADQRPKKAGPAIEQEIGALDEAMAALGPKLEPAQLDPLEKLRAKLKQGL